MRTSSVVAVQRQSYIAPVFRTSTVVAVQRYGFTAPAA
jgi:hypothetical protein